MTKSLPRWVHRNLPPMHYLDKLPRLSNGTESGPRIGI